MLRSLILGMEKLEKFIYFFSVPNISYMLFSVILVSFILILWLSCPVLVICANVLKTEPCLIPVLLMFALPDIIFIYSSFFQPI
jgi:hypothetical protein